MREKNTKPRAKFFRSFSAAFILITFLSTQNYSYASFDAATVASASFEGPSTPPVLNPQIHSKNLRVMRDDLSFVDYGLSFHGSLQAVRFGKGEIRGAVYEVLEQTEVSEIQRGAEWVPVYRTTRPGDPDYLLIQERFLDAENALGPVGRVLRLRGLDLDGIHRDLEYIYEMNKQTHKEDLLILDYVEGTFLKIEMEDAPVADTVLARHAKGLTNEVLKGIQRDLKLYRSTPSLWNSAAPIWQIFPLYHSDVRNQRGRELWERGPPEASPSLRASRLPAILGGLA